MGIEVALIVFSLIMNVLCFVYIAKCSATLETVFEMLAHKKSTENHLKVYDSPKRFRARTYEKREQSNEQ
jgi:hypothetical protein